MIKIKLIIAIVISVISVGLLVIYGVDVVGGGQEQGFLPFDATIRGIVLGVPSTVLPIVAFFITRKEKSKILGFLILVSGALMFYGSSALLIMQEAGAAVMIQDRIASFGPVLAAAGFIVMLGIIKLNKS